MSIHPPFMGNPGYGRPMCGRTFTHDDDKKPVESCPKPATWHVMWTQDCENGTCCDEHMDETRKRWAFYAAHRMLPACTQEGSLFIEDLNVCLMPDDLDVGSDVQAMATVSQPYREGKEN